MEREQGKATIRVLVAGNTSIYTQLLADALRRDRDLEVISSDCIAKSVIEATLQHDVDVLVISSNLEEQADRGLEVLRKLHASRPRLRAVVLLDSSHVELILNSFRAGARGVLSRFESIKTLCKCVRSVHRGQIWASSEHISLALEALASAHSVRAVDAKGLSLLSKRETDIVQGLADGLTNREIAERLRLSEHTVKNYLFRVFDKTGVSSRIELVLMILTQRSRPQSMFYYFLKSFMAGDLPDSATMAECQQAAERGVLIAQLALVQFLLRRKSTSNDTVEAYKWYLIASGQVLEASKTVSRTLTMEQLLHAEQSASIWLQRRQRTLTFSDTEIRNPDMQITDSVKEIEDRARSS